MNSLGDSAGEDTAWHRVHPLTPAVRSWRVLVIVLVFVAQDFGQSVARGGLSSDRGGVLPNVGGWVLAGGGLVLALIIAVGVGFAVLSWRVTRYRITAEALELNHGILFRQQRRARLDRLQAVDVVQPFVARIFGLASLTLEVAGGSDSKIALAYLTEAQATSLRAHLLARAAGVTYDTEEAPQAPEHPVLDVGAPRLIASLVRSSATVTLAVGLVGSLAVAAAIGNPAPLGAVLPILLSTGAALWTRFSRGFGFRVATSPDGLRLRHGLLEQRAQTVPPGRVQALRLEQPLLWRGADWWRVQVNVAGYGQRSDDGRSTESTLLPVGTRAEAMRMLLLVLPASDTGLVEAGLVGSGEALGFVGSPPAARWVDPLVWRRTGVLVTPEALLVRRGWLRRHLDVVPHARTQSLGIRQGPIQRRLHLAHFALHSTPGPIHPVVPHLDASQAAELVAAQAERARHARVNAGPERWMQAPPAQPA